MKIEQAKKVIEEIKETKSEAEIIEVPTSMGTAVRLENGDIVSQIELEVKIYNMLLTIKKAVA